MSLTQCLCQAIEHHQAQAFRYCHDTNNVKRWCDLRYLWILNRIVRNIHHPERAVKVTTTCCALQHCKPSVHSKPLLFVVPIYLYTPQRTFAIPPCIKDMLFGQHHSSPPLKVQPMETEAGFRPQFPVHDW